MHKSSKFEANKKSQDSFILGEVFENGIDNKEHIFFLSSSKRNTFTNYVKADNKENNPIIQKLHLKP